MNRDTGTFRGLCNCELPFVRTRDGSFVLGQPCPVKPAGAPMIEMNQTCGSCAYKGMDLPRLWAEQAQAQAQAQAPAASPVQAPYQVQMTVVPLALTPEPAFAPTPAPAPVLAAPAAQVQDPAQAPVPVQACSPPDMAGKTSTGTIISLAMLNASQEPDQAKIVEETLDKLGGTSGPSVGGISWHTLDHTCCWLRAYRALVLGLRQKKSSEALAFGSLYHEALAQHYSSGGNLERTLGPIEACRLAGASEIAAGVRNLIMVQLTNPDFVEEETKTWCPRAVEYNAIAYSEPVRINGKNWKIPFSCRHDLLVHLRQPHEAVPTGPTDNMFIVDHKCLHEDEEVWLGHGRFRAGDLIGQSGVELASVNDLESGPCVGTRDARFDDNGLQECFLLRTASGRESRLTREHPVWTDRGWVKAAELQPGDFVACAPIEVRGNDVLTDVEMELLGYFLGDGSFSEEALQFSSSHEDVLRRVARLLDVTHSSYGISQSENRSANLRVHKGTPFWKLIREELHLSDRAATKRVPAQALNASKKAVRLLLAGLWSTDGCVSQQDCRGDDIRITYCTISPQLARDAQQLLLRLGIWSSRRSYTSPYKDRSCTYWQVCVNGRASKQLFLRVVGSEMTYHGELTTDKALAHLSVSRERGGRDPGDVIPATLLRAVGIPVDARYKWMSRWVAKAMAEQRGKKAHEAANTVLHWDTVESCESIGEARTVAIEIGGHVFLSGDGLVTHNTTSSMTQDLIKGYLLDGQLMQNCFIFREVEEPLFGKLRGFIVTIAAKHKNPGPQSFHRVRDVVDDAVLGTFYKDELLPRATELLRRLTDEGVRKDVSQWPMNRQECVRKFVCPYFNMCAYGETSDYYIDEKRIFDPSTLSKPKSGYKGVLIAPAESETAAETRTATRKSKADYKKEFATQLAQSLAVNLAPRPQFAREFHLVAGHTEKSVQASLIDQCILTFRKAFAQSGGVDAEVDWPVEGIPVKLHLKPKGLGFICDAGKGTLSWKDIIASISKDWWSLDKLDPATAAKELRAQAPATSAPPLPPPPPPSVE